MYDSSLCASACIRWLGPCLPACLLPYAERASAVLRIASLSLVADRLKQRSGRRKASYAFQSCGLQRKCGRLCRILAGTAGPGGFQMFVCQFDVLSLCDTLLCLDGLRRCSDGSWQGLIGLARQGGVGCCSVHAVRG